MGILTLIAAAALAVAPAQAATVAPAPVLAATPSFRHYSIDQGLPSSNVYTVVQDQHGVIWMGTITGLARFDGTHMKVFRHVPGDPSSLASDDVSAVLADSRGRLWAGGEGSGVNLFQPATGTFRHFKHDPKRADSLAGDDIMALAQGRDGTLWVGMWGHGLDHMTAPGHFTHYTHQPGDADGPASNNVVTLHASADGTLWVGTDKGVDIRRPDGTWVHVRFVGHKGPLMVFGIDGTNQRMRIATGSGMFVATAAGTAKRLLPNALPQRAVLCSVRDRQGNLWIGAGDGLFLVRDGKVTYFPPRPLMPDGQRGHLIWHLMVDHEGGLWVATQNSGVAYLSPDWRNFTHYSHEPDNPDSLADSHARALAPDGHGNLWVAGGADQLDKLDPATGKVSHFGKLLPPNNHVVVSMAPAAGDGLWLGFGSSLKLLDDGHIRPVAVPPHSRAFRHIVSNGRGTLYASAVGQGVYAVQRKPLKATPLKPAFTSALDRQTSTLLIHDGELWRASHAGVSRLPAHSSQLVPVPGVSMGVVSAMAISGHNLWLVRPDGLEHYRLHDQHASLVGHVAAAGGWPGIVAYSMRVDPRGRVWIFAAAGLWRYDPATHRFQHYGKNDGLPSPEFTSKKAVRLPGGAVFAGTQGGVLGFRPAAIKDRKQKPQLEISSIRVRRDGKDVTLHPADHQLHLNWNDRDLRITAQALSYLAPKRNHYRFELTGLDRGWVDTGTRGVRELAGLQAGHYSLRVQAAGPSGAWATLAAPLVIDVDAPPWLRPWAWLIYVLVALALGYLAFAYWHRRLTEHHRIALAEQQRQLAEAANAAKTRFLATLSHEIRTPMTGVLGMAELLIHGEREPKLHGYAQAIRHSGELLLKLVNDALDLARIEAGRLELEPAPMDPRSVLGDVRELLHGQALKKGLELGIEVDASVPARLRGDALRIKQILLNLSNNALKFTEHGGVYLSASYVDGALQLAVRDTGPGISDADRERLFQRFEQADSPARSSGSGLGLAICRELVALMGGRITLDSTPGTGSRFHVSLPLPQVSADGAQRAPAPAATSGVARRLLLVEDNATVAATLKGLLETRGHQVTHAAHSLEALTALEGAPFDAMLVDLDLPGMDGYQLARSVRQRDDGRHLPMAAVTARSGGDEERRAHDAGMDSFARKPLSGDELAALVEHLCNPRKDGKQSPD